MATLASATDKWARKTAQAGTNWRAGVDSAVARGAYCEGISRFLGVPAAACQTTHGANYNAGVQAVSAADFQAAVQGKAQRWAENYRRAFGA